MFRKMLVVSTLLLLAGPSSGWAQRFEIAPLVGYRFGGKFSNVNDPTNNVVTDLKIDNSISYGAVADIGVTPKVFIELLFERQPTKLFADIPNAPIDLVDLDVDYYHIGLRFESPFQVKQPRGFLTVTGGATNFIPAGDIPSELKASFGTSLGGEYFFLDHVGAVVLLRYVATFFNSSDQFFCPPDIDQCLMLPSSTTLHQFEISGGVSFAF
jgi:hypothetical protein